MDMSLNEEAAMGRPPIGKVAMTEAEKKRRQRAGLAGKRVQPDGKPTVVKADPQIFQERDRRIAALVKERDALVKERDHLKQQAERRQADEQIDPATLSMSAQQKLEAFKRKLTKEKDWEVKQRVEAEVKVHIDEWLPRMKERIDHAEAIINRHKGLIPRATYRQILSCLHPDSRNSTSDEKLARAFNAFEQLERVLVKEEPSQSRPMPTYAEMMEMRRKTSEKRSAAARARAAARKK
jgi:hypothetical protein